MSLVYAISIINSPAKYKNDYEYEVNEFRPCAKSKFRLCVSSKDLNIDNIEAWLIECQSINNTALKVKVKKKAVCCNATTVSTLPLLLYASS